MKIDFYSHVIGSCAPEETLLAYQHLADHHLSLLKQQFDCEFCFWKISGVFFVAVITALVLQDRGVILNAFIPILFSGVGCLLAFAKNTKMDLEFSTLSADYVSKGSFIEKQ